MPLTMLRSRRTFFNKLYFLILCGAFLWLYHPILPGLIQDWRTNENYSHGFFIPLISSYMIFTMRGELRSTPLRPSNWGVPVLLLGLLQLWIASVGSEYFLQRTSLIWVLLGAFLFLLGKAQSKFLLLPTLYLFFMVPLPEIIWNTIAFPMQLFSSVLTTEIIAALNIPVFREGNVLHLAQTSLEVVDACSGLRSLTTMFAFSTALAWYIYAPLWRRGLLFLSAAPIAIFANVVRLTGTAILASVYGAKAAQGFLHEFSGLFTFVFGLSLLVLFAVVCKGKTDPTPRSTALQ